ncbi:unnamed protein product, partial [Ilex paraguariensis]
EREAYIPIVPTVLFFQVAICSFSNHENGVAVGCYKTIYVVDPSSIGISDAHPKKASGFLMMPLYNDLLQNGVLSDELWLNMHYSQSTTVLKYILSMTGGMVKFQCITAKSLI